MADLLFITPEELVATTIMGGNIDPDKYTFSILNVQLTVVEPLLGTELYNKIISDIIADSLTGLYKTLYDNYIKPIVKNESCAEYVEVASLMLNNGGLYKHTAENSEQPTKDEIMALSQKYHGLAQMYILRFDKWIEKNPLEEYKVVQDEVNANQNLKVTWGWHL